MTKRTRRTGVAAALLVGLLLGGCAASMADLTYPLPKEEGAKRQLNKGLWDWI